MAHRVFRRFPSLDEIADRIEAFTAHLAKGEYKRALSLCPIEDLAHHQYENEELETFVAERCSVAAPTPVAHWASRLGLLDRTSVTLTRRATGAGSTWDPADEEVAVRVIFHSRETAIVARFVMHECEKPSGRWSIWFERFER